MERRRVLLTEKGREEEEEEALLASGKEAEGRGRTEERRERKLTLKSPMKGEERVVNGDWRGRGKRDEKEGRK